MTAPTQTSPASVGEKRTPTQTPTPSSINDGDPDMEKQLTPPNITENEEEVWVTGLPLWIIVTSISLVCFLMLLDSSILGTATPQITNEFHSLSQVGWYAAAYQLASACLQPLTGKVYSNFSTKWTFFAFFLVFELGSLLCGVSTSSNMLIVSRAVGGMGASGIQNGALTIIAGCVPMPKRPALMGILMGTAQLGLVAGPLFGGLLTEFVTWRWCFYLNLPIGGLVAILLLFLRIPEQIQKPSARTVVRSIHHKLDLIGFALFVPWIIMLLLAVQWGGNQYPWNSSVIIGLFCGAGASFFIWLAWDWSKRESAMIPLAMLRPQHVWTSFCAMLFLAGGLFVMSYYLPLCIDIKTDFQGVRGKNAAISGVDLLPSILSQLVAAVASGKLLGHFGYYLPWIVFGTTLSTVGYGLLSTLSPTTSSAKWAGYQIIVGVGRGCAMQMPLIAIQSTVSPAQVPVAMSLLVFGQNIGGAIFLSLADTIFTNRLRSLLHNVGGINVEAVIASGGTGLRSSVASGALGEVLEAYADSVDSIFYMCTGLAGAAFILCWGMGWVDIRKKK